MGARAVGAGGGGSKDAFLASLSCSLLVQPPLHRGLGKQQVIYQASLPTERLPARLLPTSYAGGHEPSRAG